MAVLFSNVGAFGPHIAAAALAVTGFAPTISVQGNTNISPSAGAVQTAGYAPAAYIPGRQSMGPGLLFGLNVLSSPEGVAAPSAASVSFTGYAPTPDHPGFGLFGEGSDDLEATEATVSGTAVKVVPGLVDRFPGAASLSLSGSAPVALQSILAGVGSVTVAGYEPSIAFAAVLPGGGSLSLTGHAPDLLFLEEQFRSVPVGGLSLAGTVPTLAYPARPNNGTLTLASSFITLNTGQPMTAGSVALTGHAPVFVNAGEVRTGTGALTSRAATTPTSIEPVIVTSVTLNGQPATLTDQVYYVRFGTGDLHAGAGSLDNRADSFNAVLTSDRAYMYGVGLVLPAYGPVASLAVRGQSYGMEFKGSGYTLTFKGRQYTL
jgi:hypothetical protein